MNKLYPIASSTFSGTINGYRSQTSARDAVGSTVAWADRNVLYTSTNSGTSYLKTKLQFIPVSISIFTKDSQTKILVCSATNGVIYNTNGTVDRVLFTGITAKSISVTAAYLVVITDTSALVYDLQTVNYTLTTCTFDEPCLFGFVAPDDDYLKIGSFISNSEIKFYEITGEVIDSHVYTGLSNIVEISQYSNEDILVECTYNSVPGLYKIDTTSFAVELLFEGTDVEFAAGNKVFDGILPPVEPEGPFFIDFSLGNVNLEMGV